MLALCAAAILTSAALWTGAQAGPGKKGHACPMNGGHAMLEGADVQLANIEAGVTLTVTSKDPAVAKKIQEAAAAHVKDGKWTSPKKGCKGHKPGCRCADGKTGKQNEKKAEEKK